MYRYPPVKKRCSRRRALPPLPRWLGLLLLLPALSSPRAARAQARPLLIRTYYDSAQTRPRTTYFARLSGSRPDTVPHGPFRRFWPGGSLEELGHFTAGQPDSIWTRYYPAAPGQKPALARRLPMREGKPDGPFTVWYPDGRVGQRGTFRNGQLVDSLLTYDGRNRVRLEARFQPAAGAVGLSGTFRHWPRRWSFQARPGGPELFPEVLPSAYSYGGYYAGEPARDPRRYWQGQLQAGQLTDTLTEFNANQQPRTRLVFDAPQRLAAVLRYYPVEQLINETYDSTVTRSELAARVQALGPRRLRYEQWNPLDYATAAERARPIGESASVSVYRTKARVRHPNMPRCGPAPPTQPRPDVGPLMEVLAHVGGVRRYARRESSLARRVRLIVAPHAYQHTGLKKVRPRHLPDVRVGFMKRFAPRLRLWQKRGSGRVFRPRLRVFKKRVRYSPR